MGPKGLLGMCSCSAQKAPAEKTTPMAISTSEPFEPVTIGFLTIPSFPSGDRYALAFVGHFPKFSVLVHTKDQTALTTAKLFWENMVQPYILLS